MLVVQRSLNCSNRRRILLLKYFVQTTEDLLLIALIIGLIFGYAGSSFNKTGKNIVKYGFIAGLFGAGVMAYLKNATKLIDTSLWNLRIFIVSLSALVLFLVFTSMRKKISKAAEIVSSIMLALIMIGSLLHALPDVLAYPYAILMVEKSVLSTTFMFKCIGIIFGLILVYLVSLSVSKGLSILNGKTVMLLLTFGLSINAVRQIFNAIRIMVTKRMIKSNSTLFSLIKFSSNHDKVFVYSIMAVCIVIPIILLIKSFSVNEPYSNAAEHRKIRFKWIVTRRWACLIMACLVLSVLNMTVIKTVANREVELSPVEETEYDNENVYVTFEQVEDGHLHRFAYVTKDDVQIRFIVIKKPNSSSYGIGLDACDICGETGYYEKDGQVVCKLCDVVMNINTIGFKGGCNPIVIPYNINNGKIIVPIDGLLEYEKEFK